MKCHSIAQLLLIYNQSFKMAIINDKSMYSNFTQRVIQFAILNSIYFFSGTRDGIKFPVRIWLTVVFIAINASWHLTHFLNPYCNSSLAKWSSNISMKIIPKTLSIVYIPNIEMTIYLADRVLGSHIKRTKSKFSLDVSYRREYCCRVLVLLPSCCNCLLTYFNMKLSSDVCSNQSRK